ncbi:MAG: CpaD family pilus assembly lipoprotein [Alphaproteobacteria bacterium]|nr:CpaD family pilus assembly lipoprotein [Alphaproteobacteria bacterium]
MTFLSIISKKTKLTLCLSAVAFSLSGCGAISLHEPGTITQSKIKLKEGVYHKEMKTADVSNEYLAQIARHHAKYGASDMDVIVTYDPKSYRNTAMIASEKAADFATYLRDNGVGEMNPRILPVNKQGDQSQFIVSYEYMTAHKPDDCKSMPGLDNTDLSHDPDYEMGCSTKIYMAKQIARPKDLMGQENPNVVSEGRSASNIVEGYRTGAKNEPLDGFTASDIR